MKPRQLETSQQTVCQISPHVCLWTRQIGATFTGFHSRVNTLTETVHKPSLATRIRDLIAGDSGFTLLETLAVMVIVGLLAAITVPQIAKWREKAYITALKTDARNIANAVEASYVDNQTYPATFEEFAALVKSDVKLNPMNVIANAPSAIGYSTTGTAFTFRVYNIRKSPNNIVEYSSNGRPTIIVLQ